MKAGLPVGLIAALIFLIPAASSHAGGESAGAGVNSGGNAAESDPGDFANDLLSFSKTGYQVCLGQYALCAASTCTPTGNTIQVNVAGGGTASFPEVKCTCPVYNGPAIADVNGGNMQGSCAPPGDNQVWSLYWPKMHIPQAINNWSKAPADTAVGIQLCSSDDNVGDTFTNCFSFACTLDSSLTNGVKTATCLCPMGENPDGSAVPPDTAVITPAGQCNPAICSQHPVGVAESALNGRANECLHYAHHGQCGD
jgi:hypothetical protein